MIFPNKLQAYVYIAPVDMRKSIDGLASKVQCFGSNPFSGNLYVFSNKQRNLIKILYWHTNGFCLWMKRLEREKFVWPKESSECFAITEKQLAWLLDGLDFSNVKSHKELKYSRVF